jgi:flavin-dependent dehydrogenase
MEEFDIVIAGGGPGGSAAATFLARAGRRTLLLEKEAHPRFRIGESLLPYGNDLLREMGVWDKVAAAGCFMPKYGAEFCTADGLQFQRFSFAKGLGAKYAQTYQVERAKFDALLIAHAAESGCTVRERAAVTDLELSDDTVTVAYTQAGDRRAVRAAWFLDATGRDTLAGRLLGLPKRPTLAAKRIATYAHFRGVFRNDGPEAGNITIARLPGGWFWFIPINAELTSVGYVRRLSDAKASGLPPDEEFTRAVADFSGVGERLRAAERVGEFRTTSDYSYRFSTFAPHPRVLLTGDAAGFVDPIFSSGVMMALKSARLAARLILASPGCGLAPAERRRYTRDVCRMMDVYVRMIHTFYDDPAFEIFMHPQPLLGLPAAVAAVVGGNTDLPFRLRWRLQAFYLLCALQRRFALAPRIPFLTGGSSPQPSRP